MNREEKHATKCGERVRKRVISQRNECSVSYVFLGKSSRNNHRKNHIWRPIRRWRNRRNPIKAIKPNNLCVLCCSSWDRFILCLSFIRAACWQNSGSLYIDAMQHSRWPFQHKYKLFKWNSKQRYFLLQF